MIAMPAGPLHPSTVSVVIPAFNSAPYIRQALDSVLAQTSRVFEIIVVDGGSRDGTREVVAAYGEPVQLVDQTKTGRKGIAGGRNAGIDAATGEWVAFLDSDDWWDPGKLAQQFDALQECPKASLCYTGVCLVWDGSGERQVYRPRDPAEIWPRLRWNNEIGTSTVVVRRSVLREDGGFREDLASCEDWELWVRLRLRRTFVCCPAPLSFYRVVPQSTSHGLQRHLDAIPQISGSTMVSGLSGWHRWTVERRLWANQLYGAMVIARENGGSQAATLLLRSLAQWPFPTFLPKRYKALLSMLVRRVTA
jgi:glycosyltransferase involved in cell wall biosynthesis